MCVFLALSALSGEAVDSPATAPPDIIEVIYDRLPADPGVIARLGAGDMRDVAHDHPAEALNLVPGVNIQIASGQEHLIAIRSPVLNGGAGQGSFLVLLDGLPVRASAFGNVNGLLELPYETASGLEVIKGPGSAKYGSNAVHGMINVLSPRMGDGSNYMQAGVGSLGRARLDAVFSGGDRSHPWGGYGVLRGDHGWRSASGGSQQKIGIKKSWDQGLWSLTASLDASSLAQETAGFVQGEDAYKDEALSRANANPEAFRDAQWARLSARALRSGWMIAPYFITQRMEFRQHFLPYKGLEKNGHDAIGLTMRHLIETDRVQYTIGADVQFADGFLMETQDAPFGFFPGDTRFPVGKHYDYEVNTQTWAFFGEAKIAVTPQLSAVAGMRGEAHRFDYHTNLEAGTFGRFLVAADRRDDFSFATPKFGVQWRPSEAWTWYANYSRGARAPQASDLYRLQSLQGVGDGAVETIDAFEIGGRGILLDDLMVDVAAFRMEKEGYFFRDADGLNVTDGATDHQGIELSISTRAETGLTWSLGATYADHSYAFDRPVARTTEAIVSGNRVDTAPEILMDARLGYRRGDWSAEMSLQHVGEYFTDAANIHRYPGHMIVNLNVEATLAKGMQGYAVLKNAGDVAYADRVDFAFGNERYFPGEPRNLVIGVRKSF